MFGLFYIDQDGNYGEAEGLLILHPDSVPDEWRDRIGKAMDSPKPELLKVINDYCVQEGLKPAPLVSGTPCSIYSVGFYEEMSGEFAAARLREGLKTAVAGES